MSKNKKRIVLSSLILVMVVALVFVARSVGAWLTDQQETDKVTLQVGNVEYNLTGTSNLFVTSPVVPGQNLVEDNELKITNQSNVDSQIRFKFTATYDNTGMDSSFTGDAVADELLLTTFDPVWQLGTTAGLEGYYYLNGEDGVILANTTVANAILTSLILDGSKVGNQFAGKEFTIKFTFQAKQADHLTWQDAGSIDFITGI